MFLRAHLEGVVQTVPEEPLLLPGTDLLYHHMALVIAPHDLADGKALAHRVQKVRLHILEALNGPQLLPDEVRDLLVTGVVPEGDDLIVQASDSILPGLELAEQVGVLLLHLLEQLHLTHHVPGIRLPEDLRQPDGGEAVAGVFAVFVRDVGHRDLPAVRPGEGRGPHGLRLLPFPL